MTGVSAWLSCADTISASMPCTISVSMSVICLEALPSAFVTISFASGRLSCAYSWFLVVIVLRCAEFELAWLKPIVTSCAAAGPARQTRAAAVPDSTKPLRVVIVMAVLLVVGRGVGRETGCVSRGRRKRGLALTCATSCRPRAARPAR